LTEKVARRGYDIFREYSVDPLERFLIKDVISDSKVTELQKSSLSHVPTIFIEDTCRCAADQMAEYDVAHLIVVSRDDQTERGVVSVSDLLKARRFHSREESQKETMFPILRKSP
jgi:hypothetical protein